MMNAFNSYAQNQGYNTGMPNFQTMGYGQPQMARAQMTNPLTDEERKLLQQQDDSFDLKIKPEDLAKAICTHKDPANGTFATIANPDGSVTCKICHATFRPNDVDEEFVTKAVDSIINTLQTCKMIGVDLNNDVTRQFFAIMPYLEKVPKLYKMVNKIFNKYNQQNPVMPNNAGQNIVGAFNMLTNPAVPIGGNMPQYGYGYGMPQQTPFMNMQNNMVNGANPFYQQTPQYNGFNPYMNNAAQQQMPNGVPQMNQPQANPQAAPQQNPGHQQTPVQGETVTVDKPVQL